jgi:hypothetical protein
MSDSSDHLVDDTTRSAEQADAEAQGRADRAPTPNEERLAESHDLDPDVADSYQEATERGANVEGEGAID